MKKSIFTLIAVGYILVTVLAECNSPSKKVENAKENLEQANEELNQAQKDSVVEFLAFKKTSEDRISENEKAINSFKSRMATDKKHMKETDQKIIDDLEQKNITMRKKIDEYQEKGKDEWLAFKVGFNHDMEELGNAIKKLGFKNTK